MNRSLITRITATAALSMTTLALAPAAMAMPIVEEEVVAAGPEDIVQQVGLVHGMDCATYVNADLNWAGVADGGWTESWAEWVDGGKGGAVCTRTLWYDTATESWSSAVRVIPVSEPAAEAPIV